MNRDATPPPLRVYLLLLFAAVLLAGFLLRGQIGSVFIANAAAIQVAKTIEIALIDYHHFPNCQETRQYAELEKQLEWALDLDSQNRSAWLNLIKVRWASGDCAAVEAMLASGPAIENPSLVLIAALLDIQSDQFKGRAVYPEAAEMGKLLAETGKEANEGGLEAEAVRWYEAAFLFDPTITTADWLATYYTASVDTEQIERVWNYLAQEQAGTDDGWWAKFQQAKLAGNIEGEIDALKRGAESGTDPYQFWVELGNVYKQIQAYQDAITAYEEAHRLQPDQIGPVIHIGDAYRLMNDFGTAERYFALAHSMDINNYYVYYYMSVTYRSMGRLDDAIHELQKGIDILEQQGLNPWEWYQHVGNWSLEAGNCSEARAAYEQALEWQPGEASVLENLRNMESCQ